MNQFILIPGRSSRQGVTLNEGKYTDNYLDETSTLRMHPDDMQQLGVADGQEVRIWNDIGEIVVPCIDGKDECPPGLIFICYGDKSSQLMPGETHGTGMPDSKGLDVWVLPASQPRPSEPVASEPEPTPVPQTTVSAQTEPEPEKEPEKPAVSSTAAPTAPTAPAAPNAGSKASERSEIGPALVMCLLVLALIAAAAILNIGG